MSRIHILPETVAHQIAAGEVVERPASVLKELLENSLDAGSTRVEVELRAGGRDRVRVRDNGIGMDRADAELALARHATSKIRCIEDLDQVGTLGFRGEALPSIASVSRLTLRSRAQEEGATGTEVEVEGGRTVAVRDSAWPLGTEIDVQHLFFNVPARRKFIKSPGTELSHCMRLAAQYALVHPEIDFEVVNEHGVLLSAPPVAGTRERIFQVLGQELLEDLIPFDQSRGAVRVHGFTSLPTRHRSNRYSQFFFVNSRMVRDKTLTSAVLAAYRQMMPEGAYPALLLFLQIPPGEIDVNVHPAKTEIRFRDGSAVFGLIRSAIEQGLMGSRPVDEYPSGAVVSDRRDLETPLPRHGPFASRFENQAALHYQAPFADREAPFPAQAVRETAPEFAREVPESHVAWPWPAAETEPDMRRSRPPRAMGQFLESFIVAAAPSALFIVDQHVAHERILYDEALRHMDSGRVAVQKLLVPRTVPVAPVRRGLLPDLLPELQNAGFDAEIYGGDVVLKAIPSVAAETDVEIIVKEILEGLERSDRRLAVVDVRKRIAVSVACHSAIKVHTPLSQEKMQWLLDELYRTENPTSCPHGRPVLFRLGLHEILRSFKRV